MYKNLRTYARDESAYVHTPIPEVDIMRNGNKSRQLLSLARLVVLALCFTLVFAIVLTSSTDTQFAFAATRFKDAKDGAYTIGKANPISPNGGEITASDFNMGDADSAGWSATVSYTNVVPSIKKETINGKETYEVASNNVEIYKEDGNTELFIDQGDANSWGGGVSNAAAAAQMHMVINFSLGSFINNMINSGLVTVKATVKGDFNRNDNVANMFVSVVAGGKALTGEQSYKLRTAKETGANTSDGFSYNFNKVQNNLVGHTGTVELTKEQSNLAIAYGGGWGGRIGGKERYVKASNISITFSITPNGTNDGSAPIVSSKYDGVATDGVNTYAPYITNTIDASNQAQFPVFYDSIKNRLKTDSVTNGTGTLASYTNKALGNVPGLSGKGYYKFAQTEFVDTFNYTEYDSLETAAVAYGSNAPKFIGIGDRYPSISSNGGITWGNIPTSISTTGVDPRVSGIATVKVGNTVFTISNASDLNTAKEITVTEMVNDAETSVSVGYAIVKLTNSARVVVSIYFTKNCSVETKVTDNGEKSVTTNLTVSGIDTTAPSDDNNSGTSIFLDNFVGANGSSVSTLDWFRQNTITTDANFEIKEDEAAAGYSPYLWFYTVDRADSISALNAKPIRQFATYADVKSAGILPIAVGELTSFTYDFERGQALTIDRKTYQGNPSGMEVAKGHGYYRFTFYMFDLAGNKGGVKSFVMKADYDKPEYTLDFKYDKDGMPETILASENGKWATGDVTLKFTVTAGGFSGFTFRFEDSNGTMHAFVINGLGEHDGETYKPTLLKYMTAKTTSAVDNNTLTININGQNITVKYAQEDGKSTFTFSIPKPEKGKFFYEWVSEFYAFEGQYATLNAIDSDDNAIEFVNVDWSGGVKVLIDVEAPELPGFTDEEDFISEFIDGVYEIPQSRTWYTSSFTLDALLNFSDAILSTDYASGLKIHYGISVVKSLADLQTIKNYNIDGAYKTATDPKTQFGFLRYIVKNGAELDNGGATNFVADLLAVQTAGMRVIHIWAEDQAGNLSAVNKLYVFVDTTSYTVSASVKSNAKLESGFANITLTDVDDNPISSVKRGETVKFNISLANGYVPFKFVQNGNLLLENYDNNRGWTKSSANANGDFVSFDSFDGEGASSITLTFDDAANLSDLLNNHRTTHAFELSARKAVTYSLTNTKVAYTAEPTDVAAWMSFGYEPSKDSFKYEFVDGEKVVETPTKVGDYTVRIYIPKNDESFVTDDFAMDGEGNQVFVPVEYSIVRGKVVITARDKGVVYGDNNFDLDFDVTGIAKDKMEGEGISVGLYVNGKLNSHNLYDVGAYQILNNVKYTTQDAQGNSVSTVDNYDVTFVSGEYSVARRSVTVDAWQASKKFGDPDPEFRFGVELSQFAGLYAQASEILDEIFEGYRKDADTTVEGYAIYFADGRINRAAGERVFEYAFQADANLFDVNKNYTVRVQTSKYTFSIQKRIVKLDVSGQSSVFPHGTKVDEKLATIFPTYKISASDMVVASNIEALFENGLKIKLGAGAQVSTESGYSATYKYAIILDGTLTDGNIEIALDTDKDTDYIIYITVQNAIVIRVKDGVKFEFTFGYRWNDDSIKYDANKFVVEGDVPAFDSVVWTTSIANDELLNAGKYVVTVTGAKLYNDGTELSDAVFVEPVSVTINPAKVVVNPTSLTMNKVYGDKDDVFGIGFAISTVGGQEIGTDGNYAGIAYADILASIKGAYVRAIFNNAGERLSFANRYDDATNASNIIYGTDGRYYGFAVGTEFYSSNANFSIEASLDSSARFSIEQKTIDLNTKRFVGLSKTQDGNADVPYEKKNVTMYDLSYLKVLATDDVNLFAFASYDGIESGTSKITFTNLSLTGDKAHNYKLGQIVNDGMGTILNGEAGEFTADVDENTVVKILWIDNENGGEVIRILRGTIAILKSDVTISKQYDNTKNLTIGNITVASGETTDMLNSAKKYLIEAESSAFGGVNVSNNYSVNVAIFFGGLQDYDVKQDGIYEDSDIVITPAVYNGESGLKITFKNMKASITKRLIDKDSFDSLDAVDRDYNATDNVDMTYSFAQGALAEGDTAQTVGLQLKGLSAGKDAGTYTVSVDKDETTVLDNNYAVDADSINNAYKNIDVVISRARLVPDVTFNDRVYSGSSELTASDWSAKTDASGKGTFTSMQYAENLKNELELFSYDTSKVSFMLSKEGKADANVQANGKHNVMLSGLEIVFNGTEEEQQRALKNFKLEGSVYSDADNQYHEFVNLTLGEIDDFEIIDALNMSKKQIQLKVNDFVVKDKVYDGTTDVNVVINITDDRLIAQHADLLEVVAAGTFARKQAGDSIAITLSAAKLQAKGTLSGEELATALEAIENYELLQYKGTITGNIKARPLLVSVKLGEREYNGDESAIKSDIEYTFDNMIAEDERYYAIQTRNNAYFDDRFVNVKRDAMGDPIVENGQYNVLNKQGTAYNLRLTTIKEKYTNYTLVYNISKELLDGKTELLDGKTVLAYVADDIVSYGAPAAGIEADEYWCALDTTKYYVAATDENRTAYEGNIVGFYKHNGNDVLMLEKTYAEKNFASDEAIKSFGETADEINYLRGEGKITQRSVYIRANGIERNSASKAFEKYYDGTDRFFGVGKHEVGEDDDYDYQYTAGAVANVVLGDDVTIADVSAKFDSAYANAKYVVFTASGITGKDAYNYTIEGKSVSTVNLEGRIKQRIVNAHLADETADYGIATGKHTGDVTYYLVGNDGNEYALVNEYANESAFYMTLGDYLAAVGFEIADATLFANNTYNLENGRFVKAAESAIGEYIRLGGTENDRISALPQAYVSFASTMPDAGSVSTSYRFRTDGNAKNFKFSPVYTDEANGTSKVEVKKKDLYVVTVSNGYTANYGQFIDKNGKLLVNVELLYLDKDGKDGIVSGQTQLTLFKKDNVNYYPIAKLGVYNSETGEVKAATAMSKTSDKLGTNEYYVFYLVAPDGVDYNDVVKNYNVILADENSIAHKDVDGTLRTVFDMSAKGATVRPETATLQIVLPKLTGVSVGSDTENSFTYTYSIDKDGNGINRLHDVVQGELSTDEVIFVDDNGNELYPVNFGTYSGTVHVRRYINADGSFVAYKDKDANGYYIEWNSGAVKKEIKIEKAEVGLRARNVSEYYNGKAHAYVNDDNRADRISYNMLTDKNTLNPDDYEITYQMLDGNDYVNISQNDVKGAGKYRVTVKLTDKFLASTLGSNYKQSISVAEFQVLRAIVEVELKQGNFSKSEEYVDGSTVLKLTGEYVEGTKYSIDYNVKMNAASNDPEIAIEKRDTKLVGLENVNGPGKYSFAVVISGDYDENNYVFLTSTGVLELTTKNLVTVGGSSITFNDGKGVVADRLEVKEIKTENALASDMSYLKAVEQYVAAMSRQAGVEGARVAAVLRVNLYLDNAPVTYTGSNTTITVELPQSVKNLDGIAIYYVNASGGLTRLTDYTVEDGKLTYTTDCINGIVFVDVNPQGLEAWKVYVIAGACSLFALIVIATVVTIVVKKSKLKKID